jgi:fatty acid desaturase
MTAPTAPTVRAGDREREKTADQLGQALSQGYLEMDEYETRLQAAFGAHTTTELRQLVADLPLGQLRRNDPRRREARRAAARRGVVIHLAAYLAMVVIVLAVWLAVALTAGAWYFWPIWPILGAGIGLVSHAIPIRAMSWVQCGRHH